MTTLAPINMTTLAPGRRKRQATLPGITTPIIEIISTPIIETTFDSNGISNPTSATTTEYLMLEVLCTNDSQLIGADGNEYVYNEQDPKREELCDNTTVIVASKMVYSENDIGNSIWWAGLFIMVPIKNCNF